MNKNALLGLGLSLALFAGPTLAADEAPTFHAFSKMPTGERVALAVMADDELASVEGGLLLRGRLSRNITINLNLAVIIQTNLCTGSCGDQINFAVIIQQNRSRTRS